MRLESEVYSEISMEIQVTVASTPKHSLDVIAALPPCNPLPQRAINSRLPTRSAGPEMIDHFA